MKKRQKYRRSLALIGAAILCMITILTVPIGAATTSPEELPVRYALRLHIDLEDLAVSSNIGGDPDVQLVPADDSGIPPAYTDPESPDYGMVPEEYAGWDGIFRNAVFACTGADGSVYMEQSSYWHIVANEDGSGDGYYMDFTCDEMDMPLVVQLWYFPESESVSIYCDRAGASGYNSLDIYLEPQFTESETDGFAAIDTRDLSYVAWLAGWGFEVEVAGVPDISFEVDNAFAEGKLVGYEEGYAAAQTGYDRGYNVGYSEGYDGGYDYGFADGQTDALNATSTFKKVVFAIFAAPVELIDGILNFDVLGINVASLVRTLLTLTVVGIIVFYIFKLSKGG